MEPRRALLIAAWVLSTAFMMAVTYRAVSLVGGSVTDQPTAASFTNQAAATSSSTAPTSLPPVTDPEFVSGATTGATSPPPTSAVAPTTTSPRPTTATSAPDPPTSTTNGNATTGPFTFLSQGGSVTVFCRGDDVVFNAAVPAAGYAAEIKSVGPDQVEVFFESDTTSWEIEVECKDGQAVDEIKRSD